MAVPEGKGGEEKQSWDARMDPGRVELSKPPNFFPGKSRDLARLDLVRRLPMYRYHAAHCSPRVGPGTGTLPRHPNSPR